MLHLNKRIIFIATNRRNKKARSILNPMRSKQNECRRNEWYWIHMYNSTSYRTEEISSHLCSISNRASVRMNIKAKAAIITLTWAHTHTKLYKTQLKLIGNRVSGARTSPDYVFIYNPIWLEIEWKKLQLIGKPTFEFLFNFAASFQGILNNLLNCKFSCANLVDFGGGFKLKSSRISETSCKAFIFPYSSNAILFRSIVTTKGRNWMVILSSKHFQNNLILKIEGSH